MGASWVAAPQNEPLPCPREGEEREPSHVYSIGWLYSGLFLVSGSHIGSVTLVLRVGRWQSKPVKTGFCGFLPYILLVVFHCLSILSCRIDIHCFMHIHIISIHDAITLSSYCDAKEPLCDIKDKGVFRLCNMLYNFCHICKKKLCVITAATAT